MKKNLILGLFLTSVLLMSVVGVSAQEITGEIVGADKVCNTDSDCSAGQTCVNGVCEFSQQFWYCASGSNACAGSSGCYSQLSECRTETGTQCKRCRLEIAISQCTPPCSEGQTCVNGECQGRRSATASSGTSSLASARGSSSPGRNWVKAYTADNEECWTRKASTGRTSLFGGRRILGRLFE